MPDYSKFLIHPNDIIFQNDLGEGNFGKVQKIIWRKSPDEHIPCACKSLKENENLEEFQKEIFNMLKFRHENVVIMYGVVMDPTKLLLVVEFCDGDSLMKRLKSIEKPKILVTKLKDFAHQIAKGLKYLARKNIVHNDIAARNILLSANETIVKIGDFGLARQLPPDQVFYLKQTMSDLPVSWMSPEAIIERKFSTFSDIWSYGVLLYEMFGYGRIPWQGSNWREILSQMTNREHLEQPQTCPDSIFQLMEVCWSQDPHSRTDFDEIERVLSTIAIPIMEIEGNGESDFLGGTQVIVVREIGDKLFYCQDIKNSRFGSIYGYLLKISEIPQNLHSFPSSSETRVSDNSHEAFSTTNGRSTSSTQPLLPLTKNTPFEFDESRGKSSIKEKIMKFLKIFGVTLLFLGLFIAITIIFQIWNQKPIIDQLHEVYTTDELRARVFQTNDSTHSEKCWMKDDYRKTMAISYIHDALSLHTTKDGSYRNSNEICKYVKNKMDASYSTSWYCIFGEFVYTGVEDNGTVLMIRLENNQIIQIFKKSDKYCLFQISSK